MAQVLYIISYILFFNYFIEYINMSNITSPMIFENLIAIIIKEVYYTFRMYSVKNSTLPKCLL